MNRLLSLFRPAEGNRRAASSLPRAEGPAPLISTRDLTVCYGRRTALAAVDMDILPGRITAVIGPSGCGKTTFLCCLNRMTDLLPDCRVTGSIRFEGIDLLQRALDVVALRRRIGMIFQKPNPFPLSIRRNLEMPLREHGMKNRAELAETVEGSLRDVGLWEEVKDRLDTSALALSGGQQQRLCIARALALQPQVLLLDEPCSALDPMAGAIVEDLMSRLRERYTLVVVTHNLAQARRIADDVAVFWLREGCGRPIESGPAGRVFNSPRDPDSAAYIHGHRG